MTSTNDGKDVKSNQTSGQRGKSYYIDLYKSLEKHLSEESELRSRNVHLCDTWRRVHSLCQHSAASTHAHYLTWLQRHTANTLLLSEWQAEKDEHTKLRDAIDAFIAESKAATVSRNGHSPDWEVQLVRRGQWFKSIMENPWGHPVLKVLCDPRGTPPTDEEILEWLKEERELMFVARLRHLAASRKCHEIALSLATAVMERVRASEVVVPDAEQTDEQEPTREKASEPTFKDVAEGEAGFTLDVWALIADLEMVLLHKRNEHAQCIALAKKIPLRSGYLLVERLRKRPESSPREKKLWKNAVDVATLVAQVVIARCMVVSRCGGGCAAALFGCGRALCRLLPPARLPAAAAALAAPAATSKHLYTLATAVKVQLHAQRVTDMNWFVCEMYVRAITAGMNELEKLKIKTEKEPEALALEQTLSAWFVSLGALLGASARLAAECALTAFSVHPSGNMYERIKAAPLLPAISVDNHDLKVESKSEFGSWANDSRSQTNLVKTSETLKLKQTQQHTNVMSTAVFSEGEALGLSAELCQDLTVCLAGPRVKTLSWDMDREVLLENCRSYMERTHGGTRTLTTELKYLNLDPRHYQHLPEEGDDENDLYYGIEKGYEHLVELQEENGWEKFLDGSTETAYSSCNDHEDVPVRRKKKTKRLPPSSDDDCNPLSTLADDNKGEKKKERPHSKERSKERKKKTKDPENNDNKQKKTKEKKKPKEAVKPGSLASLIGVKVARTNEIAFTDSDYDSQGKSSQASEGNDPNVIFDGLFTMDHKSPDKVDPLSVQIPWSSETTVTNGQVTENKPKRKPSVNKRKPKLPTDAKPVQNNPKSVLKFESKPRPSAVGVVSEQVKRSITKLLQFRRNQNAVLALKNNTPKSNAIFKPDYPVQPFVSPKSVIVPEIPKSYITKTTVDKTTPLRSPSAANPVQPNPSKVNEYVGSTHINRLDSSSPHIRPAPSYSAANFTSPVNYNAANVQSYYQNTTLSHQPSPNNQPQTSTATSRSFPNDYNRLSPKNISMSITPVEKPKREVSAHEKCFEDFLEELKMSINAGTGAKTSDSPTGVIVKKDSKPLRGLSITPSTSNSDLSVHCAKPAPQKKAENAPNTFSRLSYMHKNKQSDIKQKQALETQWNRQEELQKQASLELSRTLAEFKNTKINYIQTKGETVISRVENPLNLSSDSSNVLRKADKSPPASRSHPVMTSMLQNTTSLPQTQISRTDNVTASKVTSSSGTYLSEKDQNDLLLLLRQQNRINANKPVSRMGNLPQNASANIKPDNTPNITYPNILSKSVQGATALNNSLQQKECTQGSKVSKHQTKPASTVISYPKNATHHHGANTVITKASDTKRSKATNLESNNLDWETVMNAIRAQKTPSRGPSALELTLNNSKESLRNQRIVRTNSVGKIDTAAKPAPKAGDAVIKHTNNETTPKPFGLTILKGDVDKLQQAQSKRPDEIKKPQYDIQNRPIYNKNVQYDIQNRPIENKKAVKNVPPKRPVDEKKQTVADKNKFAVSISKNKDPFISGRDDDYNLSDLDDLLDDDIRRELGELSSDEDAYRIPQAQKGKATFSKNSNITKPGSSLLKEKVQDLRYAPDVTAVSNDQSRSANDQMTALNFSYPKSKEACRNQENKTKTPTQSILINQTVSNVTRNESVNKIIVNKNKSALNTDLSSQNQIASTSVHKIVNKSIPKEKLMEPSLQHRYNAVSANIAKKETNKINVNNHATVPSHHEEYASAGTSKSNNVFVVNEKPVIQVAVPAANVVVFGSEMYYNPMPTIQTQIGPSICTVNQSYVQQNVPNINLYQPARFMAPVITPVVLESNSVPVATSVAVNTIETTRSANNQLNLSISPSNQHINEAKIIKNNIDQLQEPQQVRDKSLPTSHLDKNVKFDIDSNKNERKVTLDVQENKKDDNHSIHIKLPQVVLRDILNDQEVNQNLTNDVITNPAVKNRRDLNAIKDIERLKTKRLAILNREITQRCLHPPIALSYSPIFKKKPNPILCRENQDKPKEEAILKHDVVRTVLRHTDKDVSEKIEDGLIAEKVIDTPLLLNYIDTKNQSKDEHSKENAESPVECRRILLRSSNKNLPKTEINANDQNPVGRKTKVRLKKVLEKSFTGTDKLVEDSVKEVDKPDELITPESKRNETVKRKIIVTKRKRTKLTSATSASHCSELPAENNESECKMPSSLDGFDIEEALLGAKISNSRLDSVAVPPQDSKSEATVEPNVTTKKSDKVIILQNKKVKLRRKRKSAKIVSTNTDDNYIIEPATNIDSGERINSESNHLESKSITQSQDQLEKAVTVENKCLDKIIVTKKRQTVLPKKSGLRSEVTKQVQSNDLILNNTSSKLERSVDKINGTAVSKDECNLAKAEEISKSTSISNKASSKITNISSTIADLINQINNGNVLENKKAFVSDRISEKGETPNSNTIAKKPAMIASNSNVFINTVSDKNNDIPQSYKDSIIIEEIPNHTAADNVSKLLRVKLPNGKVYKASVYGKMHTSFDSLFECPSLRAMLMSNFDQMKYTLNIKQVSTPNRDNPNKPIDTRIQEIHVQSSSVKPAVVETINLLSDDEESDQELSFKTKCGVYKTSLQDKDIVAKHQAKFDRNCFVRLIRPVSPKVNLSNKEKKDTNVIKIDGDSDSDNLDKILLPVVLQTKNNIEEEIEHSQERVPDVIEIVDETSNDSIDLLKNCPNIPVALITDVPVKSNENEISGIFAGIKSGNHKTDTDMQLENNGNQTESKTDSPSFDSLMQLNKCNDDVDTSKEDVLERNINDTECVNDPDPAEELDTSFDTSDADVSSTGSASILHDFALGCDAYEEQYIENGRTSPLIDVFEIIASLRNKNLVEEITRYNANCQSEWLLTKRQIRQECYDSIDSNVVSMQTLCSEKRLAGEYSEDGRSSPVVRIFEVIASLRQHDEKNMKIVGYNAKCESEWLSTKRQIQDECKLLDSQDSKIQNIEMDDCLTGKEIALTVPSLVSVLSAIIQSSDILDHLQHITKNGSTCRINTSQSITVDLKRKMTKVPHNIIANKISKNNRHVQTDLKIKAFDGHSDNTNTTLTASDDCMIFENSANKPEFESKETFNIVQLHKETTPNMTNVTEERSQYNKEYQMNDSSEIIINETAHATNDRSDEKMEFDESMNYSNVESPSCLETFDIIHTEFMPTESLQLQEKKSEKDKDDYTTTVQEDSETAQSNIEADLSERELLEETKNIEDLQSNDSRTIDTNSNQPKIEEQIVIELNEKDVDTSLTDDLQNSNSIDQKIEENLDCSNSFVLECEDKLEKETDTMKSTAFKDSSNNDDIHELDENSKSDNQNVNSEISKENYDLSVISDTQNNLVCEEQQLQEHTYTNQQVNATDVEHICIVKTHLDNFENISNASHKDSSDYASQQEEDMHSKTQQQDTIINSEIFSNDSAENIIESTVIVPVLTSENNQFYEVSTTIERMDETHDNTENIMQQDTEIYDEVLCVKDIINDIINKITTIEYLKEGARENVPIETNIILNKDKSEELSEDKTRSDETHHTCDVDIKESEIKETKCVDDVTPTAACEMDENLLSKLDMQVEVIVVRKEESLSESDTENDIVNKNIELDPCDGMINEDNTSSESTTISKNEDLKVCTDDTHNNDQIVPVSKSEQTCDELIRKSEEKTQDNKIEIIDVADKGKEESNEVVDENRSQDKCLITGIEYEDPDVGTLYVLFPIEDSASDSATLNDSSEDIMETIEDTEDMVNSSTVSLDDILEVNIPKITYSKQYVYELKPRNLKRKIDLTDNKFTAKKYRKGKNIDYPKITAAAIIEQGYSKEYKRVFDYSSSLKFSYAHIFHNYLDYLDIDYTMNDWPIKGPCLSQPALAGETEHDLFKDLTTNPNYEPFPVEQSLAEEINQEYRENSEPSSDINETNFSMGFGEGSGRVIQNLEDVGDISKVSAATLSDVKQPQPFLLSAHCEGERNNQNAAHNDELQKIQRYLTFIKLRQTVKSFFQKTTIELKSDWLDQNKKDGNYKIDSSNFPFDLYIRDFMEPPPFEAIVQVVQVGQLPVSAAAQNPVTCDPRVTQVSNASPSQCSAENSPHDDSSTPIKTEYTELTTADLTLPLVQDYAQHNQAMSMESHENQNLAPMTDENIPIETEIKSVVKIELEEMSEVKEELSDPPEHAETDPMAVNQINNDYNYEDTTAPPSYETNDANATTYEGNNTTQQEDNIQMMFNSTEKEDTPDHFPEQKQNGSTEKTDQIAHAMNAAGITTASETIANNRAHALVNMINQKIRQNAAGGNTQTTANSYPKTTSINAMALQQALAQILPPPLNQTNVNDNQQSSNNQVTPQVLHIVQGKNASGSQITLVDNSQQSVISGTNTPVLHIVQNKSGTSGVTANGAPGSQSNSFSGLSLVDAGLQQGGNQLLHIVNTGSQKNNNAGQLLKRVNLLTNLANVQGSNEQKMVQFVCKSADGKSIQLNAPHQRSMVLRLQPIESPAPAQPKPGENQDVNQSPSAQANKDAASQQEIKSRSVYEENYAKFIQNSGTKPAATEKSTSLPKFNQAFGKPVFQDGTQKSNDMNSNNMSSVNTSSENNECQQNDNAINLEHIGQISSPPLLLRKSPAQTSQAQTNLVQQIKQTIAPMNIQTMHGGVIYTRQIPVNIGGGQTINLITVPSTELIDESGQKQQSVNQGEMEPSIIKIVPQSQTSNNSEMSSEDGNAHMGSNENNQNQQPQPVLTQMRIKLPMLSKTPQMVSGARVVRPSFFQIQRNVIGGANQPVYQQLVLTAAPPLGQQTIRLPTAQANITQIKVPTENQSSTESMSSSTLEQLREFDMVLEQVKERSTVQPNSNTPTTFPKLHTSSSDTTDNAVTAANTQSEQTQVLYSIGNNQQLNVAYVNRKATVTTPTTSTFVRSPDSSGIADSPTSSTHVHIPHTVTTESTSNDTPSQPKPAKIGSKSKSRPKSSSNPPNSLKINPVPPKTSTQKPLEDEQTTQRILYILAEYKEQVENSPDKDKPAPRRRSNPPSNPSGHSKRKKSSSGSRRPGMRDMSPVHGDETCRTMGSEDSSCGTSQGDCNESCLDSHSPQDSPRKIVRKLTFEQETPVQQPRPQPQRNVIVADGQTITVARGTGGKPATAVLMPANYILPVSMVKGGQQIAIVTNRGPKLLTVGGGEGGATNALLLQRLIGPAGLKPVLARPGVRHVRLPTAALHNLQAFNLATATTVQPPDSTASPAPAPTPELVETRATSSPWTNRESEDVKPERGSSPEGSEPWNLPSSADPHDYTYEETVRADNMDRTVLDQIPDRYSPDLEAQRIFDKMFDVDSKKSYIVDSPRCGYDIDASDCDDKAYQVVHKKDGSSQRHHRLTHVSAAALRHKYAILEHELRLQKSLSEECEDLGVDSPSASELFPEAELLFAASPAHDHTQDQGHQSHTPQPTILNQSGIPQPDMDDQIATDQLLPRGDMDRQPLELGLEDVGIVSVGADGMHTITLDHEEFARAHPNTTFHTDEPTDDTPVQPFTIAGLKGRHITSTIFHSSRAPATVLMAAPQSSVISQADAPHLKYADLDNMINSLPAHNNINLSSVLVKDDGLTRFDNILNDSRELHLTNTAPAIVHSTGNATQVIRRVCYDDKRDRDASFLMDEPDALIAGDDAKMIAEDSSRDATLESMADVDDDRSSPERHAELFWESNSASERSESRRPLDFSSDSDKCCKSPSYDETNSTDSSGVGTHMRLDSVIKDARGIERSGSADGSSADDAHPPLRTYPPKRLCHPLDGDADRSLTGKTRAGERAADGHAVRRRASGRGVVKRGCHCCGGSPPRAKKPRQRRPHDFPAT